MEEIDPDFLDLVTQFMDSSRDVRDAAELIDGDPIKKEMVKEVLKDFDESYARSEAVRLLVEQDYSANREFVLSELREIIKINNRIATKIRNKLVPIVWN